MTTSPKKLARTLWFQTAVLVVAGACVGLPALGADKPHGKPAKPAAAGAQAKPTAKGARETEAKAPVERGDAGEAQAASAHEVVERESHIEFDERMVRGQSAAGAIYLFRRAPSEFKSIVQAPDSFRERTTALVAPSKEAP